MLHSIIIMMHFTHPDSLRDDAKALNMDSREDCHQEENPKLKQEIGIKKLNQAKSCQALAQVQDTVLERDSQVKKSPQTKKEGFGLGAGIIITMVTNLS